MTQEVILYANKFLSLFGVNDDSKLESLNQINLVHGGLENELIKFATH